MTIVKSAYAKNKKIKQVMENSEKFRSIVLTLSESNSMGRHDGNKFKQGLRIFRKDKGRVLLSGYFFRYSNTNL
jgi:hypothetical protein